MRHNNNFMAQGNQMSAEKMQVILHTPNVWIVVIGDHTNIHFNPLIALFRRNYMKIGVCVIIFLARLYDCSGGTRPSEHIDPPLAEVNQIPGYNFGLINCLSRFNYFLRNYTIGILPSLKFPYDPQYLYHLRCLPRNKRFGFVSFFAYEETILLDVSDQVYLHLEQHKPAHIKREKQFLVTCLIQSIWKPVKSQL